MSDKQRVPMSKPNGSGVTAKANVLPADVKAWEAKGWKQIQPQKKQEGAK